ncbi:MAG: DsrE family protein [Salinisphaera sp.]|nr:DsrE family protein [Nevskiaceae bacterium]MDN5937080.1 DsrE family protein [Salinisphaera sp.]
MTTRISRRGLLARWLPATALFGLGATAPAMAAPAGGVVYHVDELEQATSALRNIRNTREVEPELAVAVVAIGDGVTFLLAGAEDEHGNAYAALVESLTFKNVTFKACGNTLKTRGIDPSQLHFGVQITQSGAAEIARLQNASGYAYFKP